MSWYTRAYSVASLYVRAALSSIGVLKVAPGKPGVHVGRVARAETAERDLSMMARSPVVFAAATRRAFTMGNYPIIGVFEGKPVKAKWADKLRRLFEIPHAIDLDALFPTETGERLLAQLVVDLLLTGNAFIAITIEGGIPSSLYRLHPGQVTLTRTAEGEFWVQKSTGQERRYPRNTVAHLRLLSWETSGAGELGTGAGEPLEHLVNAESKALQQTATMVGQGGADVMVTGTDAASRAFLSTPANREAVGKELTVALAGGADGTRRVYVVGGQLEIKDSGLKPADLRAAETLAAAEKAELMTLGVTPISIGADAGTYATAVQQYRTQAENDETLASILEAGLFRPLARHLAKQEGGRWAQRADQITARLDLSSHPGYAFLRTEQIARMAQLVAMGWTPSQAATAEGLDLPEPEGTPAPAPAPPPGNAVSGAEGVPRHPLGDRTIAEMFRRGQEPAVRSNEAQLAAQASRRERAEKALADLAAEQLDDDAERYASAASAELAAAARSIRADEATLYEAVDIDAILGSREEEISRWAEKLSDEWIRSWEEGAESAFDDTLGGEDAPVVEPEKSDYDRLEASSAEIADYSRERVRAIVEAEVEKGTPVSEIAELLRTSQTFSRDRAMRIGRTETTRSQTSGTNARYREAEKAGIEMERLWLAKATSRPSHRALDGVAVGVDEPWIFPSGTKTQGPGLSGDPGEDINCTCAVSVRIKR